ncbi:MAG TPA: hypothetical protein VFN94_05185, partial [Nitrospiria bacterium]|nr:hypothetical protein [Nitrospiria bacterium]
TWIQGSKVRQTAAPREKRGGPGAENDAMAEQRNMSLSQQQKCMASGTLLFDGQQLLALLPLRIPNTGA